MHSDYVGYCSITIKTINAAQMNASKVVHRESLKNKAINAK